MTVIANERNIIRRVRTNTGLAFYSQICQDWITLAHGKVLSNIVSFKRHTVSWVYHLEYPPSRYSQFPFHMLFSSPPQNIFLQPSFQAILVPTIPLAP